jgi:hypothetical protein
VVWLNCTGLTYPVYPNGLFYAQTTPMGELLFVPGFYFYSLNSIIFKWRQPELYYNEINPADTAVSYMHGNTGHCTDH